MSIARRLRRAAMQGKRPEDVTIKVNGRRGHPKLCDRRDFTETTFTKRRRDMPADE